MENNSNFSFTACQLYICGVPPELVQADREEERPVGGGVADHELVE